MREGALCRDPVLSRATAGGVTTIRLRGGWLVEIPQTETIDVVLRAYEQGDGATLHKHADDIVDMLQELKRYREREI